ncbi:MAG: hypothetical protein GY795_04870 [Desulfobacterales bacterium]|nr:hypothetical protein [Desulfobacterales bacterium]
MLFKKTDSYKTHDLSAFLILCALGNSFNNLKLINIYVAEKELHPYEMEVPLNDQGEIIFYTFCDGFLPFMETLKPEIETK